MSLAEFFAMGGHAFYVWTSFGAVAAVMIINLIVPVVSHKKLLSELRRQASRKEGSTK